MLCLRETAIGEIDRISPFSVREHLHPSSELSSSILRVSTDTVSDMGRFIV